MKSPTNIENHVTHIVLYPYMTPESIAETIDPAPIVNPAPINPGPPSFIYPQRRLKERLGINGTLLGVDAVKDGAQLGKDLTSEQIKNLLSAESPENRALIITVIGGQGHIFGRGNQQLSPEVIKMLPRENITVAATPAKMAGLFGKSLIADTGDAALDEELKGYVPVVTGHARRMMAKIG